VKALGILGQAKAGLGSTTPTSSYIASLERFARVPLHGRDQGPRWPVGKVGQDRWRAHLWRWSRIRPKTRVGCFMIHQA